MSVKVNLYNGVGTAAQFQVFYSDDDVQDNIWTSFTDPGTSISVSIPFQSSNTSSRNAYIYMYLQDMTGAYICGSNSFIISTSLGNTNASKTNVLVYYSGTMGACTGVRSELYNKDNLPTGNILTKNKKYPLSCINYNSKTPFVIMESMNINISNYLDKFTQPDPCTLNFPPVNDSDSGDDSSSNGSTGDTDYLIYTLAIIIVIVVIFIIVAGIGSLYYFKVMKNKK